MLAIRYVLRTEECPPERADLEPSSDPTVRQEEPQVSITTVTFSIDRNSASDTEVISSGECRFADATV